MHKVRFYPTADLADGRKGIRLIGCNTLELAVKYLKRRNFGDTKQWIEREVTITDDIPLDEYGNPVYQHTSEHHLIHDGEDVTLYGNLSMGPIGKDDQVLTEGDVVRYEYGEGTAQVMFDAEEGGFWLSDIDSNWVDYWYSHERWYELEVTK